MENPIHTPAESPVIEKLNGMQPWLRFIGIMMLIGSALMLLGSLALIGMSVITAAGAARAEQITMLAAGFAYILFGLLYLYPAILILRSAKRIRTLSTSPQVEVVVEALEAQRKFWKYVGICLIVLLALYVIAIALAIMLPALKVLSQR